MSKISAYSSLADVEAVWLLSRDPARGKNHATRGAAAAGTDTVSLSGEAKALSAAATGEENASGAKRSGGMPRNETQALKSLIQGMADEAGVPVGGWGLGHYRKAFRASEGEDHAAVRDIFLARYGLNAPADPVDEDPTGGVEDPANGIEDPIGGIEDPADGLEDPAGGLEDPSGGIADPTDPTDPADPADPVDSADPADLTELPDIVDQDGTDPGDTAVLPDLTDLLDDLLDPENPDAAQTGEAA